MVVGIEKVTPMNQVSVSILSKSNISCREGYI
jgi:hypothetical protein